MTKQRTNDEWLKDLGQDGPAREQALADLRIILVNGLRRGLVSQVNTRAPEFESMTDDFVQESQLKIVARLNTFAGRSKFTTWAHKITLNVALTELRRKRWKDSSLEQLTETDEGDYTPSFTADPSPTPELAAERNETMAYVLNLIETELTEKQRTALTATILQGKSISDVAHMMGTNQNALYKLLHDARKRLKQRLEEDGYSPGEIIATFGQQ